MYGSSLNSNTISHALVMACNPPTQVTSVVLHWVRQRALTATAYLHLGEALPTTLAGAKHLLQFWDNPFPSACWRNRAPHPLFLPTRCVVFVTLSLLVSDLWAFLLTYKCIYLQAPACHSLVLSTICLTWPCELSPLGIFRCWGDTTEISE